jgi:hypothetical protein
MPESRPDIPVEDLSEGNTGVNSQLKASTARIRHSGVVVPIEKIGEGLDDAMHQVFGSEYATPSDGGALGSKPDGGSHGTEYVPEFGEDSYDENDFPIEIDLSAFDGTSEGSQSRRAAASDGIKTPLRPPSPALLISARDDMPLVPAPGKLPLLPETNEALARAAAQLRERRIAESLREQASMEQRAREAEKIRNLLAEYVAETPALPVAVSSVKQNERDPVALDVQELIRIAHGKGNVVDRIDFQAQFRRFSEQYGEERFDTYLMSFLRLQQPLTLPHLNDDAKNWHVSAKAHIATSGLHGPPKVLLFKSDFTPEGKKNRHQLVELVYILQGLPLAPTE